MLLLPSAPYMAAVAASGAAVVTAVEGGGGVRAALSDGAIGVSDDAGTSGAREGDLDPESELQKNNFFKTLIARNIQQKYRDLEHNRCTNKDNLNLGSKVGKFFLNKTTTGWSANTRGYRKTQKEAPDDAEWVCSVGCQLWEHLELYTDRELIQIRSEYPPLSALNRICKRNLCE